MALFLFKAHGQFFETFCGLPLQGDRFDSVVAATALNALNMGIYYRYVQIARDVAESERRMPIEDDLVNVQNEDGVFDLPVEEE
jgi:hypothetical protein